MHTRIQNAEDLKVDSCATCQHRYAATMMCEPLALHQSGRSPMMRDSQTFHLIISELYACRRFGDDLCSGMILQQETRMLSSRKH